MDWFLKLISFIFGIESSDIEEADIPMRGTHCVCCHELIEGNGRRTAYSTIYGPMHWSCGASIKFPDAVRNGGAYLPEKFKKVSGEL
ncbi:MAG: hypothetical protein GWN00_01085 [Aliifodinibius sp.]|nr:hypothetical protein [Fodinibius sp.]NIV09925.1 hypothetical protein [Fodinibius sp.]NIY23455.1 hypothetical protein [Fodinibius sp.]